MTNRGFGLQFLFFGGLALLCLFRPPALADENSQEQITWLTFGQIPAYISSGEYKNQGIIDKTIDLIHDTALADFHPNRLQVNHKRFNIEAQKKENCYVGWKTFSDYRLFSKPFAIWAPSGIVIQKKDQTRFGPKGTILSLKTLLTDRTLKLGVIDDFAYASDVQTLLSRYRGQDHVSFIRSSTMQINLNMLVGKRIDYTIGWPSQIIVEKRLHHIKTDFLFYNMEEDQKYFYLGVSCSRCDKGQRIIARVDRLFSDQKVLAQILLFFKQWMIMSEQYESLYKETILLGRKHPKVVHMKYPL